MNFRLLILLTLCAITLSCGASPSESTPAEPEATGGQSAATSASLPSTGGGASKGTGGQSALATGGSAPSATGGQGTGGNAATGGSAPRATGGQANASTGGNAGTGGSASTVPAVPTCGLYTLTPVGMAAITYFCACGARLTALAPPFEAGCTPVILVPQTLGGPVLRGTCAAYITNVYPTGQDATPDGVTGGDSAAIMGFSDAKTCDLALTLLEGS
jgi:hypothetical protein